LNVALSRVHELEDIVIFGIQREELKEVVITANADIQAAAVEARERAINENPGQYEVEPDDLDDAAEQPLEEELLGSAGELPDLNEDPPTRVRQPSEEELRQYSRNDEYDLTRNGDDRAEILNGELEVKKDAESEVDDVNV
jgi:hypothetical protein